eukprot:PITA_18976
MTVREYTKEFYKVSIRAGQTQDTNEKVARYVNGLRMDIQDEISILSPKIVEEAYQVVLKVEEKLIRKKYATGRGTFQGKGSQGGRGISTTPRDGASSSSTQHATTEGDAGGRGSFSRGRGGRGRGREVRCYRCNKLGHKAFEFPENAGTSHRNAIFAQVEEEAVAVTEEENVRERGEYLMIIDSGNTNNLISIEVVEKLKLKTMIHPTPYKVSWLQKGHQLLVNEQCEVELQLGKYKDKIICDGMPMDVCHILLGRSWQYDKGAMHDGKRNTYKFGKDGVNHTLLPMEEEDASGKRLIHKLY